MLNAYELRLLVRTTDGVESKNTTWMEEDIKRKFGDDEVVKSIIEAKTLANQFIDHPDTFQITCGAKARSC